MKILTVTLLFHLSFTSTIFLLSHATTSDGETESTMRVLLEVKSSISEDPLNVLSDWSRNNTDYCSWNGVSCGLKGLNDSVQVVVGLNLYNASLTGSISPSLGYLQNLLHLDLSNNRLMGLIPPTLSNLTSLESLLLFSNQLTGPLPSELGSLLNLQVIRIGNNRLTGVIPTSFGNLVNVVTIGLASCSLTGSIPPQLGRLTELESLVLQDNDLTGPIPSELGNCSKLILFSAFDNKLNNTIPSELGRLKKLQALHLAINNLTGEIPSQVGQLSELQYLNLEENRLSGGIPSTFGFLKSLRQLFLYNNSFEGSLSHQLLNLSKLTFVDLSKNKFNGSLTPLCSSRFLISFDVTYNEFDGEIPFQLGHSRYLRRLSLGNNRFSGEIPRTLGKIIDLSLLDLSENSLTGPIPDELSLCTKLSYIDVHNNLLSGHLPSWLANLPMLGELKLSFNQFSGPLPLGLFKLSKLLILSLDCNSLTGSLPSNIGDLESLNVLRLDNNNLSGSIPPAIAKLKNLYELRLSKNSFDGEIPVEIGNLQNLQVILDLSYNNLSGHIPPSLSMLSKLEALNISHNQFSGEVPLSNGEIGSLYEFDISYNNFQGVLDKKFTRWPFKSFEGNIHLCGAPLGSCDRDGARRKKLAGLSEKSVVIISAISTLAAIVLLILAVNMFLKKRKDSLKKGSEVSLVSSQAKRNLVFPLNNNIGGRRDFKFEEIMDATKDFSEEFIIGSGGSGRVYKVEFSNGEIFAVKKISRRDEYLLNQSFIREVKTLGSIKHKNLLKLIGCCSNRNKGMDWNLLIYEYMENGSVWDWLHKKPLEAKASLDWDTRFKIVVGLAQAVEYLHHDCVPKIIHRDIKSSNVLLDSKMVAHLGDFGLAKEIFENPDSNIEPNSCGAVSYGYIAPEYAYSTKTTVKSDIYSMGIVLMELVSGKGPTDAAFRSDVDMVRWVEMNLSTQVTESREELIDPEVKPLLPGEEFAAFQVLEIAIQCTKAAPQERPSARQVCDFLQHVSKNKKVNFEKMNLDHYN